MMWTQNRTNKSTTKLNQGTYGQAWHVSRRQQKSQQKWGVFWLTLHTLLMLLAITLIQSLFSPRAHADINPIQAQKALIGEAANQGLKGMIACGEVIRRRGNLKGIYGLKRESFISAQPKWVHEQAEKAWNMSAKTNITKGGTHWESTDFKAPKWSKGMKKTAVIGKHVFYAEVSK